jgi:hypothetical protein
MTSLQECKLKMYISVHEFLLGNPATTALLSDFDSLFTPFSDVIDEIRKIRETQEINITGIALTKNEKKALVANLGTDLAARLYAYASMKGDQSMMKEVHYTISDLLYCPEGILPDRIHVLVNCATPIIADLKKYGVEQKMIDDLEKALLDFQGAFPQSRLSIAEKRESTLRLNELFLQGDTLLRQMDILMAMLHQTNPEFYNTYKFTRHIVNTSVRSIALVGKATEKSTGKPVKGVQFDFKPVQPGDNGFSLTKFTTKNGGFQVKNIPTGDYSVTVSKGGFKQQLLAVSVTNVERTEVAAEMEE